MEDKKKSMDSTEKPKEKKLNLDKLEDALKEYKEKGWCSWCGGIEHDGECTP